MEFENREIESNVKDDIHIIIPPLRDTTSLEIAPENTEICDIARKQLDSLNKTERKLKRKATVSNSEERTEVLTTIQAQQQNMIPCSVLIHDPTKHMHNLSSAIVSKAELEDEIREKVAKQDPAPKKAGTIEIPHELILAGMSTTPSTKSGEAQLHDQELIDILEGKSGDETEVFEVVQEDGKMIIVKDSSEVCEESTSYEIVTADSSVTEAKVKLLEREIAMRQIASLPMRKNKKSSTPLGKAIPRSSTTAQSLAAEWTDDDKEDEMILEVVNMDEVSATEPKIKILNMTILSETTDANTKLLPTVPEPKILNKNAPQSVPKILNINASQQVPASFKRSRVVKKKEIWDPSATVVVEKKPAEKMPITLPSSITIKKLTKESITKNQNIEEAATKSIGVPKPVIKRVFKKRSEIDKLLQDEGAVNMIYSLERENNNKDVPEIDVKPDQKSLIDKSQEKTSLVTKAKAIKNVVLKQSSSPPEVKTPSRVRSKRDVTPVKTTPQPTVVVTKAQKSPATTSRKKKADSWDYVYSQQAQTTCDDAMIIRRRSNSSYSSSAASPRRLSVDVNESLESPPASSKRAKRDNKETFEFTKPPQKNTKSPADKVLHKDFVEELRGKISTVITKNKEKALPVAKGRKRAALPPTESTPAKRASERRSNGSDHKEYRLVKDGKVAHIIINENPLSISLLSEMKSLLNQLEDDDCQVVLITSSEGFSEGLDYSTLVQTTVDKRKQAASDLVTAFKNFLISIAAFPKLIVCGINGLTSGIAVSMLPLFDLVFADSSATFSLPHASIGANPEGLSILKFSGKVRVNAINQLFYLKETLSASDAYSFGLITKIITEDFDEELMSCCKRIGEFSSQAMESTKSILNEDFLSSIDAHLAKEVKILQQQWITGECQENFKQYAAKGECSTHAKDTLNQELKLVL